MSVRIVFLGKLAALAGAPEIELACPLDWSGLLAALEPELGRAVQHDKMRIAVNGRLLAEKEQLLAGDGDEIALLPPVSGG